MLPQERLKHVLNTLGSDIIVTNEANAQLAGELAGEGNVLLISDLKKAEVNDSLINNVRLTAIDTDPLYAIFTSGSTGVPKCVLVSHRCVIDFIDGFTETFGITGDDVLANQAPFDFDVSVKDIYSCLKTGARLVLVPKRLFSLPVELVDYLCENDITTMIWAVSALCLITTFHGLDYKTPEKVNKILFSGEVMPFKHLKEWSSHLPDAMLVNLYGPTEITCNCTYYILEKGWQERESLPIGKAFPNRNVFLLDENNNEVIGTDGVGEICVAGTSVSLGYYNNKEQTEKAFVQNPLNKEYREIIYKTGDMAEYDADGNLCFRGRKDFQIKYMGHRIEIEEIEKAMESVSNIRRACCVFDEAKSRLYGFYVGDMDKKEFHSILKEKLPEFMVPSALRNIDEMPLTKNGKIDRKALFEMKGGSKREVR
jgi:amino acid adenylation domain-containing protein